MASGTTHLEPMLSAMSETVRREWDEIANSTCQLQRWIEARDYAGYEPYDILNSPFLSAPLFRRSPLNWGLIQVGRRWTGIKFRRMLRVPASKNPKALGLLLSGYCDLLRCGESCLRQMHRLKLELLRLRSPAEKTFCWGYDWDFFSLRGTQLLAFRPNAVATVFCGRALLDYAELTGDEQALEMALSVGNFITERLNRWVDKDLGLCFSYTPWDRTRIYNSSALAAALLTRLAAHARKSEYLDLGHRAMCYIAAAQRGDGSWPYGAEDRQQWSDSFHTGYNLLALLDYRNATGDRSFDEPTCRGYAFYKRQFFDGYDRPKYLDRALYPIDIHCCAQAVLTFCAFVEQDPDAFNKARKSTNWALDNMRNPDGSFAYQKHRYWMNRTPYMRWGQAWMFHALTRMEVTLTGHEASAAAREQALPLSN